MEIRPARAEDLPSILALYDAGRAYMRANGNQSQWGDGYPSASLIQGDIAGGHCFLCVEEGIPVGVFCYFEGPDPTYRVIEDGAWLNDAPYGVLHRIAVAGHRRGVASAAFAFCLSRCKNLRVDTHEDNLPMQQALLKNGFVRCGIIHLLNGDPRVAFQKTEETL